MFLLKTHFCFYTSDSEGEHAAKTASIYNRNCCKYNYVRSLFTDSVFFFFIHSPVCYITYRDTRMTLLGEERIPPPKLGSPF